MHGHVGRGTVRAFDDSTQGSAAPSTRVFNRRVQPGSGERRSITKISDVATQPFRCRGLEVTVQKSRPTQNKRARERARQEKQQQKTARRMEAASRKASRPANSSEEDPDIAGIVPGPQPSPWGDELDDVKEAEE